jgi:peptidoglycan-associated lipoprotein
MFALAGALGCSHEKAAGMSAKAPPVATQTAVATAPPAPAAVRPSEGVRMACDLPQDAEEAPRFAYDEAALRLRGERILDQVAKCLEDGPLKGNDVRAIGYADPRGSDAYNLDLGISRAAAAQEYLGQKGVVLDRVELATCGERVATGHDEATWAYDRRVELAMVGEPLPTQCSHASRATHR